MKLRAEIADIARLMADEVKAGEKAVHFGIRDAGIALKDAWRGQVTSAARPASRSTPERRSLRALEPVRINFSPRRSSINW